MSRIEGQSKPAAKNAWRDRIVEHVRLKASDLLGHELNPRRHGAFQKRALEAIGREVGLARSLLGYRDEGGKIRLIDGHLRKEVLGQGEVWVEVLDVSETEARKLLLSMDPLAALAESEIDALETLRSLVQTEEDDLATLWSMIDKAQKDFEEMEKEVAQKRPVLKEQWLVVVQCKDETMQAKILAEMQSRGIPAKALMA